MGNNICVCVCFFYLPEKRICMFIFFVVALAAKKGGSISSKTLIIIIVSVLVVALIFLSCCVYYLWRKYLRNKGDYHYIHMLKHSSEEIMQNKN